MGNHLKTTPPALLEMAANTIQKLIEKEQAVKAQLKDLRQDLKEAIEESDYYKNVLQTTTNSDYKPTEKAAKAHAMKVAIDHFSPNKCHMFPFYISY